MTEIRLKDLRIEEEYSLGGLEVAVEKVGDNKKFKPITITKNGTYEGGIEDGKQVGFNPVVVDVKPDKAAVVKELINARGNANCLFETPYNAGMTTKVTDEIIAEHIRFDTLENAEEAASMYRGCHNITEVPLTNTSKVRSFTQHFQYCYALLEAPKYDISGTNTLITVWAHCRALITLPDYDSETAHILDVTTAFYQCISLRIFPAWDLRGCANYNNAFGGCGKLEDVRIKNVKANIVFSQSPLLSKGSAIHLLYECRDTGSAKTITFSTETGKLLADVYVKSIPITDEMRAEDDLVDEKLPFVVCEPTDEGATLITQYVLQKNWQVAYA